MIDKVGQSIATCHGNEALVARFSQPWCPSEKSGFMLGMMINRRIERLFKVCLYCTSRYKLENVFHLPFPSNIFQTIGVPGPRKLWSTRCGWSTSKLFIYWRGTPLHFGLFSTQDPFWSPTRPRNNAWTVMDRPCRTSFFTPAANHHPCWAETWS